MANEVKIKLAVDGAATVNTELSGVEGRLDRLTGAVKTASHYGAGLAAAFGLVIPAISGTVRAAIGAADAVTTMNNQLKLATGSAQAAGRAYEELFGIAQRSRVGFTELGSTFAAISRAGGELGISQKRLLGVTEAIGNAMTISGGSAQSMQAALVQLGQGLSSGTLRGEELNSVMEQAPRLAKALADGLGVPIGKLREMGAAGEISAQQVIAALEGQSAALAKEIGGSTLTVSQAFTVLSNAAIKFTGEANEATSTTKGLSDAMVWLSDSITAVGKSALVMDALRTIGETVKVLWSDVAFVFERTGTEIGAIGAQIAAVLRGDFAGAATIRRELIADAQAARKALDAYQTGVLTRTVKDLGLDTAAEDARLARHTKAVKDQARAEEDLYKLRLKLAGVPDGYLKDMQEIIRLNQAGVLVGKEYNAALAKQQETLLKKTGATKDAAKAAREAAAEQEKQLKAEQKHWQDLGATITANEQAHAKWLDQNDKTLEGLIAGNQTLREHNEAIGLSKEAMDALTLSRQDAAIAQAELTLIEARNIEGNEARIEQIQREIRLLKERRELTAAGQAATVAAEAQKTAKDLAEKTARDAASEWQKASDQIQQSLSDALMNAFTAGKGFGKTFVNSIKAMFNTMVLRPVISAIVSPVAGALTGALGFSGAAQAAGTGANLLSGGSSLLSAGSTLASFGTFMGEIGTGLLASTQTALGLTATAAQASYAATMGVAAQTGSLIGSLGPLITAAPYLVALAGVYLLAKNLDHSGTPHTGAGTAYSAAGGLQQASSGAVFNSGFTGIDYSASTQEFTTGIVKSVVQILDTTATTFGKTAGYQAAASFADDSSKDGAWGSLFIRNMQQVLTDWQDGGQSFRTFSDGTAGNNEFLAAVSADVRTALDGIGLPDWAAQMLAKLGDAPGLDQLASVVSEINATQVVLESLGASVKVFAGLSGDAVLNIINASGGLQAFGASLGAYYENFYSEQEKFDAKLQSLNTRLQDLAAGGAFADSSAEFFRAITEPTRENFRKLIEAQDLTTASGQSTYAALLGLSGVVAELTPVAEQAAEAVQTLGTAALTLADVQKLFDSSARTILNAAQYSAYRIQQIQATLGAAGMDLSAQQIASLTREQVLAGYQQALAAGNIAAAGAILNVVDALTEVSAGFQGVTAESTSAAVAIQQVVTTLADVQTQFGSAARTLLNDAQYTAYQVAQIQATLGSVGIKVTAADILGATKEQVLAGLGEMMAAGNLDAARAILSVVDALSQVSSGFQTVAATASNAAAVMQQRAGLESTLLNLTGNTAAIRARELAALDASNRGLQQHIYAIQDAQQAIQDAQQAVSDATSAYQAQESAIASLQSAAQRWIGTMNTATSLLDQISGALGGAGGNREAALWATVNGAGDIDARLSAAQELFSVITQTAATEQAAQDNALANAKALLEYGQRLRDYVQGLKTGDLSTLTPAQKVAEALAQYQTTLAAAQGGDQTALGNLQGVADTYLRLAREFDPASYTASVFTSVTDALDSLGAGLVSQNQRQVTLLQAQLDATRAASSSANALSADQIARLQTLQGVVQDLYAQAGAQSAIANAQVSSAQANLQALSAAQLAAQQNLALKQQALVDAQAAATAYMATLADVAVSDPVPDILRSLPEGIAAALAPLLNANPASTAAAAAATTAARAQIIRDYAATLPQDETGARMLYDAAVANGVSSAELDAAMGFAPGSSLAWAVSHNLPAFAQGTNYVPHDMVAQIHRGEAIIPARYNPAGGGNAELAAEIKALRAEVRILREQNNAGHLMGAMATEHNTKSITQATHDSASQIAHTQRLQQRAALA